MARWKMIVQLDPAEGREAEFVDYYPNVHVSDVAKLPGVLGAQFLRTGLMMTDKGAYPWKYMVIYDVECDDPSEIRDRMTAAVQSGAVRSNFELLKAERRTYFYETLASFGPA